MKQFILLLFISLPPLFLNAQNVGIGILNPNAKLSVARGYGVDRTAAFFGIENVSHFNYYFDEDTVGCKFRTYSTGCGGETD
jgi:hypothetical protein